MAKKSEESKESGEMSPQQQLKSFLKLHEGNHFNTEASPVYKVPCSSLKLNVEIDGGLRPGLSRFVGISEGGKSSAAFDFMKCFLSEASEKEKRRGLYIKAEGRLDENVQERTGIKLVQDPSEWTNGTCFILKSNIFETVISLCRDLINNNPEKIKYFIVFDSMDALVPAADMEKGFAADEHDKVAGSALISSVFLKKMSLSFTERGHIGILISQVRTQVSISQYEKKEYRMAPASGGNAQNHYASLILEFMPRWGEDLIWEDATKKKKIGHYCRIKIDKSTNEKTGNTITYPIKYGRKNGTSIWVEQELADLAIMWEVFKKKGAWLAFDPSWKTQIMDHLKNNYKREPYEVPDQIQGQEKLLNFLEAHPEICDFLYEKFKSTLLRG